MIVSIGLGDTGVNVCLDDECDVYSPIRLVEMCNVARSLFAGAYVDTLTAVTVDDGVVEAEGE